MAAAAKLWETLRRQLSESPNAGEGEPRAIILESWRRSREAGVDPDSSITLRQIPLDQLVQRRRKNRILLAVAIPLINEFSTSLEPLKHCLYMIDCEGIVLYSKGTDY